jgi:hypothetical protein
MNRETGRSKSKGRLPPSRAAPQDKVEPPLDKSSFRHSFRHGENIGEVFSILCFPVFDAKNGACNHAVVRGGRRSDAGLEIKRNQKTLA